VKYWGHALFLFLLALAAPVFADSTVTYTYDALGRLVRSVSSGTSTANTSYTLDPAGNRTNVTVTGGLTLPTFSINSASVAEGGTATLTVTKSGTASGTLTVNYATADGTALAGSDYTAASGTLTFLAGDATKTIQVATVDDATVEPTETLTVALSGNSAGSAIGTGTGTVTITDNDSASFAISNAPAVTEGGNLVYTVTKTGNGAANVSYSSASGTATSGTDFTATSGTLVFASGDTTKMITVPTIDDAAVEPAETVLMNLSGATGGATITTAQGSGTINDNDASFAISNAPAVIEGGNLVYTVTKTGGGAANVNYASADGTATAGSDYTATSGTLVFAAGDSTQTISVPTTDDASVESAETVLMNLSAATGGATITTAQGSGTINDNDAPPPSFAISAASVTEGGVMVFTVTKTGTTSSSYTINYATADGTAVAASDYTAASGTLTFLAADASKTISIATTDDSVQEGTETFSVNLSAASGGATITTAQGVGTINDNDPAPSFTIGNATVTEGGIATFTVTKTGATTSSYTVNYATANGTAIAGSDYTAASGTLTFLPSVVSKTISVSTTDDTAVESAETFNVNLSGASGGATISDSLGVGTINDNDAAPPSFAVANATAVAEGGNLVFKVTMTGTTTTSYSVNYATANGTATAGSDYTAKSGTLMFAATSTSPTTKNVSVVTINDTAVEGNETVKLNLSGATGGATITDAQGIGTITDNDSSPTCSGVSFAVADASIVEGNPLGFVVTKTGTTSASCSVSYATANGTAVAPGDYTAKSGTLTFTSGVTSLTVSVPTVNNGQARGTSIDMSLNLSNATTGATITDSQGIGTIGGSILIPCTGVCP